MYTGINTDILSSPQSLRLLTLVLLDSEILCPKKSIGLLFDTEIPSVNIDIFGAKRFVKLSSTVTGII